MAKPPRPRGRGPGRPFVKGHIKIPGSGMPVGFVHKGLQEIRDFSRSVLEQPKYRAKVRKMFDEMHPAEIPGHYVALLHHYAYGKPKETVEISSASPVRFTLALGARPEADVPALTDGSDHA